jgi:hypothetical protein
MKNAIRSILLVLMIQPVTAPCFSQASEESAEQYFRSNIALTNFKILGVNDRQYAKCLESENFDDVTRRLGAVVIDKVTFLDDGRNYDLEANDGILTSTTLFEYTSTPIRAGTYRAPGKDYYVFDDTFRHTANLSEWPPRIKITATLKWVPCKKMEEPDKTICYMVGWPYGWFELSKIDITFEI